MYDRIPDWTTARTFIESAGADLNRKIVSAIGPERLAGLVNAANTSVDWIRTNVQGALDADNWRAMGEIMQRTSAEGLRKLRDVFGPERIANTLRSMKDAGIQFGQDLVDGTRALGDRAILEAAGLAE